MNATNSWVGNKSLCLLYSKTFQQIEVRIYPLISHNDPQKNENLTTSFAPKTSDTNPQTMKTSKSQWQASQLGTKLR
jgi:hypothetical protein